MSIAEVLIKGKKNKEAQKSSNPRIKIRRFIPFKWKRTRPRIWFW